MAGQVSARLEADVVLADLNLVTAGQAEGCALRGQGRPGATHITRVAGLGSEAGEAGQDGVRGAMAEASGAEGAVEGTADARDVGQPAGCREVVGEREGRPHRADRVGAGRTDPDGEEVEGRAVPGGNLGDLCRHRTSLWDYGLGATASGLRPRD